MNKQYYYSPIAVDMGAKNTGVYMPQYADETRLEDIKEKQACTISHSKLTLMMTERTAKRHQKRGYDRRQQAKRLARLVLINAFGLNFDEHQAAISFLLNRRGRILGDELDPEIFNSVPVELLDIFNKFDEGLAKTLFPNNINEKEEDVSIEQDIEDWVSAIFQKENKDTKIQEVLNKINEYKINVSKKKRINGLIKLAAKRGDKKAIAEYEKEIIEPEQIIKKYDALPINIFDFKQKYDDELPEQGLDNKSKQKYYSYVVWNIHKILSDTLINKDTGHALRETYLEHINKDLHNAKQNSQSSNKNPIDFQLTELVAHIDSLVLLGKDKSKRLDTFINVIGNISNIQLRGLRKYFNDIKYKEGDKWNPAKLDKMYSVWLSSLRPKKENQIKELKSIQKEMGGISPHNKSKAVALWMNTEPHNTIPPFEDQNNRRPPLCRSLLLKPSVLDKALPQWKEITDTLITFYSNNSSDIYNEWKKSIEHELLKFAQAKIAYRKTMKKMKTPPQKDDKLEENCWGIKNKKDALYARSLQFFLDISSSHSEKHLILRDIIPGSTNYDKRYSEIKESIGKNIIQKTSATTWKEFQVFCIEKYYNEIKKSMDGRWFSNHKDNVLSPCDEKTRNKKYQMITDFGALFGLTSKEIQKFTSGIGLDEWLKTIKGVKSLAQECAKAQKNRGNYLQKSIDIALYKENIKQDIKLSADDKTLIKMADKANKCAEAIASKIQEKLGVELDASKFNSVFTFAQIENIVFSQRSGNAKSCPCCSVDNQARMQRHDETALASRLRGYVARPIDGVVRKLLQAQARVIAVEKWKQLKDFKPSLNTVVKIPIITEQNKFTFEQELGKEKGKNKKKLTISPDLEFANKKDRIKQAGNSICPYTGNAVGGDGELDHIISRASTKKASQTVINSEANLIYVSSKANRKKFKEEYRLIDLDKKYLRSLFNTTDIGEIRTKIKKDLGLKDYSEEKQHNIKEIAKQVTLFRNFSNFLRLTPEEQIAFRHALFLESTDLARQLVRRVLQTSDKARVNGTQRYFAALVAQEMDKINIQKSEKHHKQKNLNIVYDYFEVAAEDISQIRSELRYCNKDTKKENFQNKYSHVIDATCVFLGATQLSSVARSAEDLSTSYIGLNLKNLKELIIKVDTKTGEITSAGYYERIAAPENSDSYNKILLERKPLKENYYAHRQFHRDDFYAQKFLPVLICGNKKYPIRIGFDLENSESLSKKEAIELLPAVLPFCNGNKGPVQSIINKVGINGSSILSEDLYQSFIEECQEEIGRTKKDFLYLSINTRKAHEYMVEHLNTKNISSDGTIWQKNKILNKLGYRTKKVSISEKIDDLLVKPAEDKKTLYLPSQKTWDKLFVKNGEGSIKKQSFVTKKIQLPSFYVWEKIAKDIFEKNLIEDEASNITTTNIDDFLREQLIGATQQENRKHKKARCVFSLPLVTGEGKLLQKRSSWNGENIYQITNDSDHRKGGNNYLSPILTQNTQGEIKIDTQVNNSYKSLNTNYLQMDKPANITHSKPIDTSKWFSIKSIPQELVDLGVKLLEYRVDDFSRPSVRFKVIKPLSPELIEELSKNNYLKPRKKPKIGNKAIREEYAKIKESYAKGKEEGKEVKPLLSREDFVNDKLTRFIDPISQKKQDGIMITWKCLLYNNNIKTVLLPVLQQEIFI